MDLVTSLIDGDLPLGAAHVQADRRRFVVLADDDLDDADLVGVRRRRRTRRRRPTLTAITAPFRITPVRLQTHGPHPEVRCVNHNVESVPAGHGQR